MEPLCPVVIVSALIGIRIAMAKKLLKRNTMCFLYFTFILPPIFSFGQTINNNDKEKSILIYEIIDEAAISENKILRLETFGNTKLFMTGQTAISYDYCKILSDCEKSFEKLEDGKIREIHDEITGLSIKNDLVWIHPPRYKNFRILELNAFPYYKKNSKTWIKSITFGSDWGNKKWVTWDGFKTSTSTYTKSDNPVEFVFANKKIECIEIKALTNIPDIGETNSVFYYNEKYGFVKMTFTTINDKKIEFNLIKILNDSNPD